MMGLKTPAISLLVGEGGSGGALAMAVADRVLMLENAGYSILSPEGFASILWKDSSKAEQAAKDMKMTAEDLYRLGVVDAIIPEPEGGAQVDPLKLAKAIKDILIREVETLRHIEKESLPAIRFEKFRTMGQTAENKLIPIT
jgi:acetyl-CoA carboxylase carboxyl transferase subunit alpha